MAPSPRLVQRRILAVGAAALTVGVTAVHVATSMAMRAPIVLPDELGYIDNARYLVLGGPRPVTGYYPGLSMLLAPAWWFTEDALTVWRSSLAINVFAAGLAALVIWLLVPRLAGDDLRPGGRLLITAAVASYPAMLLYSDLAMAESLFAFAALATVLIGAAAFGRGWPAWFWLGLSAGLLVVIHPRGGGLAAPVVILGLLTARRERDRLPRILSLVAGTALALALTRLALVEVRPSAGTGLGNYRADSVLARSLGLAAAGSLVAGVAGQLLYLSVATAGLVPLGLAIGLRDVWMCLRRPASVTPAVFARAVATGGGFGVLVMSAFFLNGGDRADQLIYGRYNEGVLAGPLVIALGYLLATVPAAMRRRRCGMWLATGSVTVAGGAFGLHFGRTPAQLAGPLNPSTVLALVPLLRRTGPGVDVAAITAAGAIALVVLVVWAALTPRVAMVALSIVFVAGSIDTLAGYLQPGSTARSRQDILATTISRASARLGVRPPCVAFDAGLDYSYFNDRFFLPGRRLEIFDGGGDAAPCGPFVISSRPDFGQRHPGAALVSIENDLFQNLWVMPGSTQAVLRRAGWLLPSKVPGPLPLFAERADVTAATVPHAVRTGDRAEVRVTAVNVGPGTPWPGLRGLKQDGYVVRVAAQWFSAGHQASSPGEGGIPITASFVELPRTLVPGDAVRLTVPIVARSPGGRGLAPGTYTVRISVYQELVGVLPGTTLTFTVTVLP